MLKRTFSQIRDLYRKGEASVAEVVSESFVEIKKVNQRLNVFLTTNEEQAIATALKMDDEWKKNKTVLNQPLWGMPVAYKDMFLTKGLRTTAGSKVLENYIPPYSATVVDRLEEVGMIRMGKLNQDAWAHGASGENSDYGPTKNPINEAYVPGGSSSGSAAAVAAGLVPVATGTDTGGSIRQPASFCGVVGFKPTYGRVSRYGIVAMASSLDSIGHITTCVEDAALVLEATAGEDKHDANTKGAEKYKARLEEFDLKGMKIGVPREYLEPVKNTEVRENVKQVMKMIEEVGAEVVEVSLPHTEEAISVYYIIQPAEVSSNLARYDGIRYGNKREVFGAEAKRRIMMGTYILSAGYYDAYYKTALKVRTLIKQDFDNVFEKVDLLLTPVSPTPAFKLGEKTNDPLEMYLSDVFTVTANIAGIPGISLPSGMSKNGLPLAVQLLADRNNEEKLLGAAYQVEKNLK